MSSSPLSGDVVGVRELVALRLMLEDAIRRAGTAGRYSRGGAVVALDAVVERACYLVAMRRSVPISPKATLMDIHSQLVQNFEGAWRPSEWRLVRNLHEARNGAQHMGLEPDREELPAWIEATRSYVTALVMAEFATDLQGIVLADAIDNEDLAGLMRQAGQCIAEGDFVGSVETSLNAFDAAVATWTTMQVQRSPRPVFRSHAELRSAGEGYAGRAISDLHRDAAEASFATSSTDHAWLNAAREDARDTPEGIDADDADRVQAFVFSWIVAFEVATRQWAPNRRHRANVAARRVRTTDGPARIAGIAPVQSLGRGWFSVAFNLSDVPAEEIYPRWASTLGQLLASTDSARWSVLDDGTAALTTFNGGHPAGADVEHLAEALTEVEPTLMAQDAAAAHAAEELAVQAEKKNALVAAVRGRLPDWVTSVTWEAPGRPNPVAGWRFTLDDEVAPVRIESPDPGQPAVGVAAILSLRLS